MQSNAVLHVLRARVLLPETSSFGRSCEENSLTSKRCSNALGVLVPDSGQVSEDERIDGVNHVHAVYRVSRLDGKR